MPDVIAGADPLPMVLARLRAGLTHEVGARNEPPYPRVIVTDPPGGFYREARWLVAIDVQIEVVDDLHDPIGRAALKRLYWDALAIVRDLPEAVRQPGDPVVTNVAFGGGGWAPLPTGQSRYVSTVTISAHPPQ